MEKYINEVKPEIKKMEQNQEYEVKFNDVTLLQFNDVINFIKTKLQNDKSSIKSIEVYDILDVCYQFRENQLDTYRISIKSITAINNIIKAIALKKNNVAFSYLVNRIYNTEDSNINLTFKEKEKYKDQFYSYPEFNIQNRLSKETEMKKENIDKVASLLTALPSSESSNISFRFKNRISCCLYEDTNFILILDITSVKLSNEIINIQKKDYTYEIELELFKKQNSTSTNISEEMINKFSTTIEDILKILQGSKFLITQTEKERVLEMYQNILSIYDIKKLYSMQPITLELQHLLDYLPHKYSITDKADGEKFHAILYLNKVFLISNNLQVKYTGLTSTKLYNNTIIEGELINDKFMAYDILCYNGKDLRELKLNQRIEYLNKVVENVHISIYGKVGFKFEEVMTQSVNDILEFHSKELDKYIEYINNSNSIFERKYYIFPTGISNIEVFAYASLLWKKMSKINYSLDGLIFTGINQTYTLNKNNIKLRPFKWKPPHLNSIDVYIEFEKDETGKVLKVYDNSDKSKEQNKIYIIANVFVGSEDQDGKEKPVQFLPKEGLDKIYLFLDEFDIQQQNLQEYYPKDIEGNIIMDNTVIEISYTFEINKPLPYRWKVLRTRYDKTYNVHKNKLHYGNYEEVAQRVWISINHPVKWENIEMLGSSIDEYENHSVLLRKLITPKLVAIEQNNAYFQLRNNIAKPMRRYHNWIKSILMYEYFRVKTNNQGEEKRLRILDVGIGTGQDLQKYYTSKVKEVIGVDKDLAGLTNATDGAYNFKRKFPDYPPMKFIHGDFSLPMDIKNQVKALGVMSSINKDLIKNYFSKNKYDAINCQFVIHYFLKDEEMFNNFCKNVNLYLDKEGYLLVTTFDGNLIKEYLGNETERGETFLNQNLEKQPLFVIRNINIKEEQSLGQSIDFFNAIYREDYSFLTEYLVYKEFLINELNKRCDLELIETQTFKDLYELHRPFFTEGIKYEADERNRKWFSEIREFYDLDESKSDYELMKASLKLSHLYRYFVFKKSKKRKLSRSKKTIN